MMNYDFLHHIDTFISLQSPHDMLKVSIHLSLLTTVVARINLLIQPGAEN